MQGVNSVRLFDNPLQQCPNLQTLYMDYFDRGFWLGICNTQPLKLPSLRSFFITTYAFGDEPRLPTSFSLPQLCRLSVTSCTPHKRDVYEWPCPAFTYILQSCSSTLRTLSLYFPARSISAFSAHRILELLPSLTHLDISSRPGPESFLESLLSTLTIPEALEDMSSIAVLNLKSLSVAIDDVHLLTETIASSLVRMMLSRTRRNLETSILKTAVFDFRHLDHQLDAEKRVKMFEDSRLFLEIIGAHQLNPDTALRQVACPFAF
ncbi:hypothetical protein L218DRAFT_1003783 [Marasmius fiardii PR-910]|nr:hypothetical protein L218DRAFT_1003783 [Marasmius fiardii PR-910]